MPQPTASAVHVNRPLTQISIAYLQEAKIVSNRVFPVVGVAKQADKYWVYNADDWRRDSAAIRAPGSESVGGGWELDSSNTYFAEIYAIHKDVDDPSRANQDEPLDLDSEATEFVTRMMILRKEKDWASTFFTTGVWTGSDTATDLVGGTDFTKWSAGGSDPIKDIEDQRRSVKKKTGFWPNKLVVGVVVDAALKRHPDLLDRIKHTQRGVITDDLLAKLFQVDEYLVADMIETTSAEGAATETTAFVVDDDSALLVYAAPVAGLRKPTGGYTYAWTGIDGAASAGAGAGEPVISRFRMEHLKSDRIEGELAWDHKVISGLMGAFFSDAAD